MPNFVRNGLRFVLIGRRCCHKTISCNKSYETNSDNNRRKQFLITPKYFSTENKHNFKEPQQDNDENLNNKDVKDGPKILKGEVTIVDKNNNNDMEVSEEKLESDYQENLLEYYVKKAEGEIDNMDDVDYYDITDVNQRLFYKMVDIWLRDTGETKRGHREFVKSVMKSLYRFNVESDIKAYLKLLDCFPEGKHTGMKRDNVFMAAFQDKIPDHELASNLIGLIATNGAVPNDKLYNKATDLFGRYSPSTNAARNMIFWYPRIAAFQDFVVTKSDVKTLSPIETAFYGLRQMNPGIEAKYSVYPVDKSYCDEILEADKKIDTIISVQTPEQNLMLANHDVATPIFVEGPHLVYMRGKRVQYYVMRSDPKELVPVKKKDERLTTLLTDKDWWSKFYGTDWDSDRQLDRKTGKIYDEESYFPTVDLEEGLSVVDNMREEIALIDKDTTKVEGPVYAIACTDYTSPIALRSWVSGLLPDNPIVSKCSVVFQEEKPFLLNAPKDDPNESLYQEYFDNLK